MNNAKLKSVTVYFTAAEYAELKAVAADEAVTVGQVVRAKMGLSYRRRGAPAGNANRARKPVKTAQGRTRSAAAKRSGGQRGAKRKA